MLVVAAEGLLLLPTAKLTWSICVLVHNLYPLIHPANRVFSELLFISLRLVDCGAKNEIKAREPIRCRECGHRIMYKKRTRRSALYLSYGCRCKTDDSAFPSVRSVNIDCVPLGTSHRITCCIVVQFEAR